MYSALARMFIYSRVMGYNKGLLSKQWRDYSLYDAIEASSLFEKLIGVDDEFFVSMMYFVGCRLKESIALLCVKESDDGRHIVNCFVL